MGSTSFSLRGKRPLTALSAEPTTTKRGVIALKTTPSKRSRPQQPLTVTPGCVSFRFLCHESRVSAFIGKAGAAIKGLTSETSAKIQIQDSLPGSDDRVIVIVAGNTPSKKLILRNCTSSGAVDAAEEYVVSAAQEALVRVFEKVLDVAAGADGVAVMALGGGTVSCRMLAESSEAGSVIGKKGKVIERIRRESGCKMRVLFGDKLPVGVKEVDEVIEIEGDIFSIKKALIAVSSSIQQYLLAREELKAMNSRPLGPSSGASMPDPQSDASPTCSVFVPTVTTSPINYSLGSRPLAREVDECYSSDLKPSQKQVVIFKLLCSTDGVGGVIGKGGSIVKAIQEETGIVVSISPAVANCDEQLVTVTSMESPESRFSPAQRAVVLVFAWSAEASIEKREETGLSKGSHVTARLLVPEHQVGCLLGRGGTVVSQMMKATGTQIDIIRGNQVPKCVSEDNEVVQISGEFVNVQDALHQVTGRLRDNLFPHSTDPVAGPSVTYPSYIQDIAQSRMPSSVYELNVPEMARNKRSSSFIFERNDIPDIAGNRRWSSLTYKTKVPDIGGMKTASSVYEMYFPDISANRITSSSLYEMDLHERIRDPSSHELYQPFLSSLSLTRHTNLSKIKDLPGVPHQLEHSRSSKLWTSQVAVPGLNRWSIFNIDRGLTSTGGSLGSGIAATSAIVTTTTVEMLVPDNVIRFLYMENGSNLTRLEQISGAKIIIHEPRLGEMDRTLVISGSPDQTRVAQSLLHAS